MQKGIIKNVNKLTGEPIDAKDLASLFSGIIGNESGVLTVFDELRLEKISDNKVRLHSGVYSLKGHILYIPKGSYEDFTIESGTLGANRIDLLVAEYVRNGEGDGEDTLRFKIVKGSSTSGAPQVPDLTQQDINQNGITRQEALYKLRLTGINLAITKRFDMLESVKSLEDRIESGFEDIKDYVIAYGDDFEVYKSTKVVMTGSWKVEDSRGTIQWTLPRELKNLSVNELNQRYNISLNITSEMDSSGSVTNHNSSMVLNATIRNKSRVDIRYDITPKPTDGRVRYITAKLEGR